MRNNSETYMLSFLDCVSLLPLLRCSTELLVLLRIRTGIEDEDELEDEDEEATLKWGRRASSKKHNDKQLLLHLKMRE